MDRDSESLAQDSDRAPLRFLSELLPLLLLVQVPLDLVWVALQHLYSDLLLLDSAWEVLQLPLEHRLAPELEGSELLQPDLDLHFHLELEDLALRLPEEMHLVLVLLRQDQLHLFLELRIHLELPLLLLLGQHLPFLVETRLVSLEEFRLRSSDD